MKKCLFFLTILLSIHFYLHIQHPLISPEINNAYTNDHKVSHLFKQSDIRIIENTGNPRKYINIMGHRVDLFYSYRHGSLFPMGILRVLYNIYDYKTVFFLYQCVVFIIFFIILYYYLSDKYGEKMSLIVLGLMSIDPHVLFAYRMDVTEPTTYILFILTLLLMRKNKNARLIGLIVAFNFYLRLNTLWFWPFFLLLEHKYIIKNYKKFIQGFLIVFIPYLSLLNFDGFVADVSHIQKSLNPTLAIQDFLNIFYNKDEFLSFYYDENLRSKVLSSYLSKMEINFMGLLKLGIIFYFYKNDKFFSKEIFPWVLSGAISFGLMILSLQRYRSYGMYMHHLSLINTLLLANLIANKYDPDVHIKLLKDFVKKNILIILLIVCEVCLNIQFYKNYLKTGPVSWMNYDLFRDIKDHYEKEQISSLYIVSETDIKKLDVLSYGKIHTEALYPYFYSTFYQNILEVMAKLEKGIILIPVSSYWSVYTKSFGSFDPNVDLKKAMTYNLKITNLKPFRDKYNQIKYWSFSFETI